MPCPLRDHHALGRRLISTYQPQPEDETAAQALQDGNYYEGLLANNEDMHKALDPLWEEEYLKGGDGRQKSRPIPAKAVEEVMT